MAEFVQKKIEDIRPVLEQMIKLELFREQEIKGITKQLKDYEYKLQRHSKSKEDYLRFIQYLMDLMKLVKQRREKYGITKNKSNIDFTIAKKVNYLYKEAIMKFQDDLRFWIAHMTFCKHVNFIDVVDNMLQRMLSVHHDKPKCWHIAARWEIEEKNNIETARKILFRGLHHHPESQLLYTSIIRLELDEVFKKNENSEAPKDPSLDNDDNEFGVPLSLRNVFIIYKQAFKKIKDIKFIIQLLNNIQEYENTEKLQIKIISDMLKEYPHEPLVWDTMANRELKGLLQPSTDGSEIPMEVDCPEQTTLRERINNCYEVYQIAVKKIKTKEMWSLFIDRMLEINQDTDTLPNFKRKLLKNALLQGHQAKKLKEEHYLNWIDMLNNNNNSFQTGQENKLYEIFNWATEALPDSEKLWIAKLRYLFNNDQENLAKETFDKATQALGKNSLPLWKLKLLHIKTNNPDKLEHFFNESLSSEATISNFMKPVYVEWIVLTKDIKAARKIYEKLCLIPPLSLELHKKMAALELLQPEFSLSNAQKPYEYMTLQFGKENTDIWMEFIKFEMKFGDPLKISNIYERAVKTLKPHLVDKFITEFSLLKANPESYKL